jgi:hypothetical protein
MADLRTDDPIAGKPEISGFERLRQRARHARLCRYSQARMGYGKDNEPALGIDRRIMPGVTELRD